ncbi:uncharacterized protein BDZ99DRAFT_28131 [Mytilinidion resinicola]|uniref:Uncharacterized protein n=1 Tax=Mytilinidion resinicola TaxID=574789 RepID=A0A6A6YKJ6_9PEZI|nr:uncharacterized protein BDZ99DRAFT_28131 [Mytilinidion resinicola]KAF2809392.1 hypothetical protein BDZ99DRAFT_28131 [Mytilinidion resinicola]
MVIYTYCMSTRKVPPPSPNGGSSGTTTGHYRQSLFSLREPELGSRVFIPNTTRDFLPSPLRSMLLSHCLSAPTLLAVELTNSTPCQQGQKILLPPARVVEPKFNLPPRNPDVSCYQLNPLQISLILLYSNLAEELVYPVLYNHSGCSTTT